MLRPRIIPCLLVHKGGLVKTRKFGSPKYVGDPINAVTMREQLNGLGIGNVQLKNDTRNGASVSRVLIGPFLDDDTLAAVRKRLLDLRLPAVPVVE